MSVEVVPGGQRRILDPGFTERVDQLGLPELRARRKEAEAEQADVSYLRWLLQGRLDILRAELVRRSATDEQDVAGLLAGLPAGHPQRRRVFSVADTFDAMTSDRAYRKALSFEQACREIADEAGSQFDPMVVDAFTSIVPGLPGLRASLHDGAVDSLARAIP
jgi:hypothetical protein